MEGQRSRSARCDDDYDDEGGNEQSRWSGRMKCWSRGLTADLQLQQRPMPPLSQVGGFVH